MADSVDAWCRAQLGSSQVEPEQSPDKQNATSLNIDDFDASLDVNVANPPQAHAPASPVNWEMAFMDYLPPDVASGEPAQQETSPSDAKGGVPARGWDPDYFIKRDPVYRNWVPPIKDPLLPLMALRGPFQRDVVCASMFDGLGSERKSLQLFSVPTRWVFDMENEPACHAFQETNFTDFPEHRFIDARHFLDSGGDNGECMSHDFSRCSLSDLTPLEVDILFVTFSCCPYSIFRSLRSSGTRNHKDSWQIDAMWTVFDKIRPKCLIMEQVFGYALSESTEIVKSPLQAMADKLASEYPDWSLTIFVVGGNTFLVLVRHRVFSVAIHESAGGAETAAMLRKVVTVSSVLAVLVPQYWYSTTCT